MIHGSCSIRFFVFLLFIFGLSCVTTVTAANESQEETVFIDLTVNPSTIEIGEIVFIEGYIVPSVLTHTGDKVLLHVTSPKGSQADVYYQLKAATNGIFSLELPADVMGDWSFITRYGDYSSDSVPLTVTPRIKVKETELTISGPFSRPQAGDTVQMSGWLRDVDGNGIPYRHVSYSFGLPSYSCALCDDDARRIWQTLGPVTTDEIGYFEFGFDVFEHGTYAVKASFPGDEIYAAVESETVYPQVS